MIKPKPLIQNIVRIQEKEPSRFYKVRLDRSERTYPYSNSFIERIKRRLDGEWLMTYPEPEPLYEKFSAFLKIPRQRILFNNGSDQSIKAVFETYISEGDRVLLHRPGYAMFPVYAKMFGAEAVFQDFDSDLNFDHDAYIDKIDSSFRMAVLENPNGFIGAAPPRESLHRFIAKCEKEGVIAVVDEAYFFFHDITVVDLLDSYENLIVIRTFSKALGVAGLRAGYTLSREENIANLYKVKPMHEINGLAILVIDEILNDPKEFFGFVEDTRKGLAFLKDGFRKLDIDTSKSVANFLAARLGRYISGEEASLRLKEKGILLRRPFREKNLWEWTRIGTGPVPYMQQLLSVVEEMISSVKKEV